MTFFFSLQIWLTSFEWLFLSTRYIIVVVEHPCKRR